MGIWYNGDIEGKFWFAVQSSDAADRFGVTGVQSEELYYYFDNGNLDNIEEELKVIKNQLGKYRTKMKEYFENRCAYSDEDLANYLGITVDVVKSLLRAYADYELGMKIRKCILANGQCEFTAAKDFNEKA